MSSAEYHNEPLTMQTIVNEAGCEKNFPSCQNRYIFMILYFADREGIDWFAWISSYSG